MKFSLLKYCVQYTNLLCHRVPLFCQTFVVFKFTDLMGAES